VAWTLCCSAYVRALPLLRLCCTYFSNIGPLCQVGDGVALGSIRRGPSGAASDTNAYSTNPFRRPTRNPFERAPAASSNTSAMAAAAAGDSGSGSDVGAGSSAGSSGSGSSGSGGGKCLPTCAQVCSLVPGQRSQCSCGAAWGACCGSVDWFVFGMCGCVGVVWERRLLRVWYVQDQGPPPLVWTRCCLPCVLVTTPWMRRRWPVQVCCAVMECLPLPILSQLTLPHTHTPTHTPSHAEYSKPVFP
jgi:hypothetical protein